MKQSISIVIPCYNSGDLLKDAVESVLTYSGVHFVEVIIVDDGSTDKGTLVLLARLANEGHVVIHQENKGPAAARNTGIKHSNSVFILLLDSDNKIESNLFIDQGIKVLSESPKIGVFYGRAIFFGEKDDRIFSAGPFEIKRMLNGNYIDMCSIIRRKVWVEIGGLDENRLILGHEDWDFWLRIGRTQWTFHYFDAVVFYYRIRQNSLVSNAISSGIYEQMVHYILSKHLDILPQSYKEVYDNYHQLQERYRRDLESPFKGLVRNLLYKYRLRK